MFEVIPEDFFKPLASKYKRTYVDCLGLIYSSYKSELSFGVDKEFILAKLENYFDNESASEMVFDEDNEIAKDSRSKANYHFGDIYAGGFYIRHRVSSLQNGFGDINEIPSIFEETYGT